MWPVPGAETSRWHSPASWAKLESELSPIIPWIYDDASLREDFLWSVDLFGDVGLLVSQGSNFCSIKACKERRWISKSECDVLMKRGYASVGIAANSEISFRLLYRDEADRPVHWVGVVNERSLPKSYLKLIAENGGVGCIDWMHQKRGWLWFWRR